MPLASKPHVPYFGDATEAALLADHGISRVPADRFDVDGYRYTNLADAVAQAMRGREVRR